MVKVFGSVKYKITANNDHETNRLTQRQGKLVPHVKQEEFKGFKGFKVISQRKHVQAYSGRNSQV